MSWILTYTGQTFDLRQPSALHINALDIGHALANQCRFTGHTRRFYSAAQHSLLVCQVVKTMTDDPAMHLAAILHDATEAYLADIASPVKPLLSNYAELERGVWRAICRRYGLAAFAEALPAEVKHADLILLATEKRDLMPAHPAPWPILDGIPSMDETIVPMQPGEATDAFLQELGQCLARFHIEGEPTACAA